MQKFELTRIPYLKQILRSRWPQFILQGIVLVGFILAIVTGLWGTPVGSRNFAIVFVWIGWWALLILIAVPIFGRGWCSICPIPMPGEWLQRGAVLGPQKSGVSLGRRWPGKLRNIWLQNGGFLLIALFSTVILTQPLVSAMVLVAFLVLALGMSLVFERRAFCRYICPVGGFIGLYSQLAPIELRVKDTALCASHTEKTCYTGNADGYGCPWQVFPGGMVKNTYCGTCMECLRTCPHDNIAINIRSFGADLEEIQGRKLDEAFKAFIMLGSAIVYSAVMLGPWGSLKTAAYSILSTQWLLYVIGLLILIGVILPGVFYLSVALSRYLASNTTPDKGGRFGWKGLRRHFIAYAYALVPLGLMAWFAFSLSFVFANLSYLWPTLSDPFGWGWNLFGTGNLSWEPYMTQSAPILQAGILVVGLYWSSHIALRTAVKLNSQRGGNPNPGSMRAANLQALPVTSYCFVITAALMVLLIA